MARQYAVLPFEYLDEMSALTDEEFGVLCRGLIRYTRDGTPIPQDGVLRFVAVATQNRADHFKDSFERIDERNRVNGAKGGRPPKPKETQENPEKPKETQKTQIEREIEKEIEIDIKSVNKRESKKETANEVISAWNSICTDFSAVKMVSDSRVRSISARLKETSIDDIKAVFRQAQASDFLKGNNTRGWKATFDWVMNPTNFVKVAEGQYKNREVVNTNGHDPKLVEGWSKHPSIGPG